MADRQITLMLTEVASELSYHATLKPITDKALSAVLPSPQQYPQSIV
jgi:hypothetical protein